jgi:hypothetical protein
MARLTLEEIARQAKEHKQTPEEKRAQRISLVRGVRSHKSTLSRDQVESMINEFEGREPSSTSSQ